MLTLHTPQVRVQNISRQTVQINFRVHSSPLSGDSSERLCPFGPPTTERRISSSGLDHFDPSTHRLAPRKTQKDGTAGLPSKAPTLRHPPASSLHGGTRAASRPDTSDLDATSETPHRTSCHFLPPVAVDLMERRTSGSPGGSSRRGPKRSKSCFLDARGGLDRKDLRTTRRAV